MANLSRTCETRHKAVRHRRVKPVNLEDTHGDEIERVWLQGMRDAHAQAVRLSPLLKQMSQAVEKHVQSLHADDRYAFLTNLLMQIGDRCQQQAELQDRRAKMLQGG